MQIYLNDQARALYSYTLGDFVPPEIHVEWKPTCPYPYKPSNITRQYEHACMEANENRKKGSCGRRLHFGML